jgi:excisionase family DNA binding protein
MIKQTYTVTEAAKILGICRSVAYQAAKTGQLPIIKIGNRILVPKTALDRKLLESGQTSTCNPSHEAA